MSGRIPKIVIVGPAYVDLAIRCNEFPRPGEMVEGAGFSSTPAGLPSNAAIEAAHCGCETYLLSKTGDDCFGKLFKDNLAGNGVNTDFVFTAPAMNTGVIVTMTDSIGENSGCVAQGANRALSAEEIECAESEQLITSGDVCLISARLHREGVVSALRVAQLNSTKVILEVPMSIQDSKELDGLDWPMEYYAAKALVCNLSRSSLLTEFGAGSIHKLKFIASELVAKGLECVVINIGKRGVMLADRNGTVQIEAYDLDFVDETASHDAFVGALAASCGAGDSAENAVRFAAAAGALAYSKFGSQETLPKKEKIIELLQNHPE